MKAKLLINQQKGTLSLDYEGPQEAFQAAMQDAVRAAFSDPHAGGGKAVGEKQ